MLARVGDAAERDNPARPHRIIGQGAARGRAAHVEVGVGALLAQVVGRWAFQVEPWSLFLGLGLSVTIGVVFGFYPGWRAARLDPIEALRAEQLGPRGRRRGHRACAE